MPYSMPCGKAIGKMLERLQTDHIDLLYLHQPMGDFRGAWRDMEKAVRTGKVHALNKEERIFRMDYEQAKQFMLNWKIED